MINRGNIYNRFSIRKRTKITRISKQLELAFELEIKGYIVMSKKLAKLELSKKQWNGMTFLQLCNHYNLCVATGVEELGKLDVNNHAYLTELKLYLERHPFNPQNEIKVN